MAYQETFVRRDQHRIYVRDHPGAEPAIILMHGFPDNVHLYDRLVPYLSPPRRVVLFDFLGWGSSDKPSGYPYTAANQVGDLDAVVTQLGLGQVILVVHDASGPPGIDWALAHPERVAGLVLLNTYYCEMPTLRPPEAIWLFSTPVVRSVARPVSRLFGNWLFRRMYRWQVGRFIRDADVRREFVPLLYQQFDATPSARPAFFRLNEDLLSAVRSRTRNDPQAAGVPASGPDHLRRRRSFPEQRGRPDVPRVPPGVRTLPDPGCPTLRPTGRAGTGGAVNPGHAKSREQPGLMLVAKAPAEPPVAPDHGGSR